MKALVIFDSFFGNTEKIANAIGKGMGNTKTVTVSKVDSVDSPMLKNLDYLVVGSPTRAFSPTPAIKSLLKKLPANGLSNVKIAAFDTRFPMGENVPKFLQFLAGIFGYANTPIEKLLVKKGGKAVLPPEGFFVKDSEGPLADGELDRAQEWGKTLKTSK